MENPCKIVCFGDSITLAYVPILESRLKKRYREYDIEIVNAGVVGDTTRQGLTRLEQICGLKPTVCIVGFGMNDWRKGVPRREFRRNLEAILDNLARAHARVLLLTMNPDAHQSNHYRISSALLRYNEDIRDLAHRRKVRVCDVFSLWDQTFKNSRKGLWDEFHPNEEGYRCTVEAIMRVVTRSYTTLVWQFNGEECFCNYACPYCYVSSESNTGHHWRGTIESWHDAFLNSFGSQKVMFYLSFGEPMAGKNFYSVLDMIASEPQWSGHMTSNLSLPLDRLVNMPLVKDGRFFINASFHPSQTNARDFLDKLLQLRSAGIEAPVVYVMYPPQMGEVFKDALKLFDQHGFLIHIRRFRGVYNGKRYPQQYNEEERIFIARYSDDATIKYMLNDFEDSQGSLKDKLTYAGMYYVLVDNEGDVWQTPDYHGDAPLGNVLKGTMHLNTAPVPFKGYRDGTVDGIMSLLELNYEEPHGNHVTAYSRQGGVRKDGDRIIYGNLEIDFVDPDIRRRLGWPTPFRLRKYRLDKLRKKLSNDVIKFLGPLRRMAGLGGRG